jgi:hypothetical protein
MPDERSQGRAAEETQRRRRRGNEHLMAAKRLPIPPEVQAKLDRDGLVPRWVNDAGNRMYRLTEQDDYNKVEGVDPVPVGKDEAGQPIYAHLLAKRREFIDEDRQAADERTRALEAALIRKPEAVDSAGQGGNPNPATAERYVSDGSKITRNRNQISGS